jgi:hypothetical protein
MPKTTNYQNTFIEVAEDCTATTAQIPPQKGDKKKLRIITQCTHSVYLRYSKCLKTKNQSQNT